MFKSSRSTPPRNPVAVCYSRPRHNWSQPRTKCRQANLRSAQADRAKTSHRRRLDYPVRAVPPLGQEERTEPSPKDCCSAPDRTAVSGRSARHATEHSRAGRPGLGVGSTVQLMQSHRSTRASVPVVPTLCMPSLTCKTRFPVAPLPESRGSPARAVPTLRKRHLACLGPCEGLVVPADCYGRTRRRTGHRVELGGARAVHVRAWWNVELVPSRRSATVVSPAAP